MIEVLVENLKVPFLRKYSLVFVLAFVVGIFSLQSINSKILGLFLDDGVYAVLAKSLYEEEGYRILSLPTSPFQLKYPFLYPYILSWVWWFSPSFPENIFLLKVVNVGFFVVTLLLSSFLYFRVAAQKQVDALLYTFLVGANLVI